MGVTKPYEFIWLGAMGVTKPYEFIRFGAMYVTKTYGFIGLEGAVSATNVDDFWPRISKLRSTGFQGFEIIGRLVHV